MWKKLQNTDLFLSFKCASDTEVFLTDFMKVWTVSFNDSSFLACVKASNPDTEGIDEDDVDKCKKMLSNPEYIKSEKTKVSKDGRVLNLSILGDKKVFGFPLHLKLSLQEGSNEMFFQKVTQPLLVAVQDTRASEQELKYLLLKKDKEIEEYKCEGGEIALRHLKTVPFDENSHEKKHTAFLDCFGCEGISTSLLTKRCEGISTSPPVQKTRMNTLTVKSDPGLSSNVRDPVKKEGSCNIKAEIKSEPSSQSSVDIPRKKLRKAWNI